MKIKNLTLHDIVVYAEDRETIIASFPPEGICPRVDTLQKVVGEINGIPVQKVAYGKIENLPEPEEDTIYIVSQMVLNALHGTRQDVFAPDSGKGAVRDEGGRVKGTVNFVTL